MNGDFSDIYSMSDADLLKAVNQGMMAAWESN
jgi:hypothetical protein